MAASAKDNYCFIVLSLLAAVATPISGMYLKRELDDGGGGGC